MQLLRQLAEKPWLITGAPSEPRPVHEPDVMQRRTRLGLWTFMAVATMLFAMLIIAYGGRMAFEDWKPGPELALLWLNTIVLLLASVAMQLAVSALRRGRVSDCGLSLVAGGALALLFVVGQCIAWLQLASIGPYGLTIPSVAFFYLITGLHALHVSGGLVAWARSAARVWRGDEDVSARAGVELCTTYWHFMLGVWLVLFGLLFSGNNLGAVLALCGLR